MGLWNEVFSGLRSWAKDVVDWSSGRSPSARTLNPFDDPALTPVRLVLDPLHIAKPFLGFVAKSGALDRPLTPGLQALAFLAGPEAVARAKASPSFTEAGEELVGANPMTQGAFFLADIAAPGPGEFGQGAKAVRAWQKLGDEFFDPDLQLAEAKNFFKSLGLGPQSEGAPAVSASTVETLLSLGLFDDLRSLDLAEVLAKTYDEIEEAAKQLPGSLIENIRSLAKEQGERLYRTYEKLHPVLPSDIEARIIFLLTGLEAMALSKRPWRWSWVFNRLPNWSIAFLSERPDFGPQLRQILQPRFLLPDPEAPLAYSPDRILELVGSGRFQELARIRPGTQILSWVESLPMDEVLRNWRFFGSVLPPDLLERIPKALGRQGFRILEESAEALRNIAEETSVVLGSYPDLDVVETVLRYLDEEIEEALALAQEAKNPARGLRRLSKIAEWFGDFVRDKVSDYPDLEEIAQRLERGKDFLEETVQGMENARDALVVLKQLDDLIRRRLSQGRSWAEIRAEIRERAFPQILRYESRFFDWLRNLRQEAGG
jgi:hypothetical protein